MTITRGKRDQYIDRSQESPGDRPSFHRSGVISSLMGMLTGLGMLTLMTAVLTTTVALLSLRFDLVATDDEIRGLSAISLAIAAVIVLASTVMGGFVAGRLARYGGIRVGIGASLWLMLVVGIFAGTTVWLGDTVGTLDGLDVAGLAASTPVDVATAAAIAGGGLVALALLGGLLGGRFGQMSERGETGAVVDLRGADDREALPAETSTESDNGQG